MKSGIARLNRALALVLPSLCLLSFALVASAQLQPGTIDTYVGGSMMAGSLAEEVRHCQSAWIPFLADVFLVRTSAAPPQGIPRRGR